MHKLADDAACITYFTPHPEEMADKTIKATASTSSGIFGNFLNRIFSSSKDISTAGSATDAGATSVSPSENCKNLDQCKHEEIEKAPNISEGEIFVLIHI